MSTLPNWTDPELVLTTDARSCFDPPVTRIALDVGERIYRLRTNRAEKKGASLVQSRDGQDRGSPWWFRRSTFDAIVGRAQKSKGNITTAARAGLAVPIRFNTDFDTLVIYRLLRPGFAWCGPVAAQARRKGGSTQLEGGLEQLWIPGIMESEVRFEFFGSVRDRL